MNLADLHRAARSPLDLAMRLGLHIGRGSRADRAVVRCPVHAPDVKPSCVIATKADRIVWHCHSCKAGGDMFALVAAVRGLDVRHDFPAVVAATAEVLGVQLPVTDSSTSAMQRSSPPASVRLALHIDDAADRWLRGLPVTDPAIESTPVEDIREALADLAAADEQQALRDDALDRLADDYFAGDWIGRESAPMKGAA